MPLRDRVAGKLPGDMIKVDEYCRKHNINPPSGDSIVLIAEDEAGNIQGLVSYRRVAFIEPLIADSPMVGYSLFNMALGISLVNGDKVIRCVTDSEHNKKLFEKLNFAEVYKDYIFMEKLN